MKFDNRINILHEFLGITAVFILLENQLKTGKCLEDIKIYGTKSCGKIV